MHAVVLVETGHGTLQTVKAGVQEINGAIALLAARRQLHSYGPTEGRVGRSDGLSSRAR